MCNKCLRGQLTLFFGLAMTTILSLVLLLIEGARNSAIQLTIASTNRVAAQSVLADYHRTIFERYGILLFDASKVEKTMESVMECNWDTDLPGELLGVRDLQALSVSGTELEKVTLATDEAGRVLWRQAVLCMEEKYGITYLEQVLEWLGLVEEQGIADGEIGLSYEGTEIARDELTDELEEVGLRETNLLDTFNWLEKKALNFLLDEEYSKCQLLETERVSSRELSKGNGIAEDIVFANNHWNELLFLKYLLAHTGNYVNQLEDGHLRYQVEYLLNGKASDGENLWETARRLLELRIGANALGIVIDEDRNLAVKELTEAIATSISNPEAAPVIYASLLLIWAEVEGIYDVKQLLAGKGVSLIKPSDEWLIDVAWISEMAQIEMEQSEAFRDERVPESEMNAESKDDMKVEPKAEPKLEDELKSLMDGNGPDTENVQTLMYKDYLLILLWLDDVEQIAIRFMDIVESDIRSITEDTKFDLSKYADRMWIRVDVKSAYGKEYTIYREYGY